jgi:hypothetical protein
MTKRYRRRIILLGKRHPYKEIHVSHTEQDFELANPEQIPPLDDSTLRKALESAYPNGFPEVDTIAIDVLWEELTEDGDSAREYRRDGEGFTIGILPLKLFLKSRIDLVRLKLLAV